MKKGEMEAYKLLQDWKHLRSHNVSELGEIA